MQSLYTFSGIWYDYSIVGVNLTDINRRLCYGIYVIGRGEDL